ncbi:DUF3265 domain-containing protein [Vibrio parahaemolyticus]|nr:DUF3265 domain-containing protein [Vibrio parahaemolyticus]EJG0464187.1 DUF3265 domain-containing protein [Vibrio parahaemolyticus]EKN4680977.1 DUF3265 domain-containing protein [Vibrio parahaemolyticus]
MTRRSRGIHAAWHFWYAVCFGGESGLRKLGLGGTHPLTQRYNSRSKIENICTSIRRNRWRASSLVVG